MWHRSFPGDGGRGADCVSADVVVGLGVDAGAWPPGCHGRRRGCGHRGRRSSRRLALCAAHRLGCGRRRLLVLGVGGHRPDGRRRYRRPRPARGSDPGRLRRSDPHSQRGESGGRGRGAGDGQLRSRRRPGAPGRPRGRKCGAVMVVGAHVVHAALCPDLHRGRRWRRFPTRPIPRAISIFAYLRLPPSA